MGLKNRLCKNSSVRLYSTKLFQIYGIPAVLAITFIYVISYNLYNNWHESVPLSIGVQVLRPFRLNFKFLSSRTCWVQLLSPQGSGSVILFQFIQYISVNMIAVIQRVSEAAVTIEGKVQGTIEKGFMILLGVTHNDTLEDVEWLGRKIIGLRVFGDEAGKMNLDLQAIDGNILLISQFTLHASTKKGNRPSFIEAARPEVAIPLYQQMIDFLGKELGKTIACGEFGADMKVSLINDGPVTIIIDSKNRI